MTLLKERTGSVRRFLLVAVLIAGLDGCGGGSGGDSVPPPDVSGSYVVDQWTLQSSNCDTRIVAAVVTAFQELIDVCRYDVSQSGASVTLVSTCDTTWRGSVNSVGVISADATSGTVSPGGCAFTMSTNLSVDATISPTTATFRSRFDFADNCVFLDTGERVNDCSGTAQARWQIS